jgi:hypothetical protein
LALWLLDALPRARDCGVPFAAVVDVSSGFRSRRIRRDRRRRSEICVLTVLGVLIAGNIVFHAEVIHAAAPTTVSTALAQRSD